MRQRKSTLHLKQFRVREKGRQRDQLALMIQGLEQSKLDLEQGIRVEEQRTKISDPTRIEYSPLAKSLRGRMENIDQSIAELKAQMDMIEIELEDAQIEYQRVAEIEARDTVSMRA